MNNNKNDLLSFLEISVYLTGFSKTELLGTGMLETYYDTLLVKNDVSNLRSFFDEVNSILANCCDNEEEINAMISSCLIPDSKYNGVTKKIIMLWYTGAWDWEPVSAEAYVQGLMWPAAQTHPAGAKQPGYDSWSKPPVQIKP